MAEINLSSVSKKIGVKKSKKLSTRVDLTPMVDLGFLLLTFFVFTTSMAEPRVMNMVQPVESNEFTPLCESCVLNLVLGAGNKIFFSEGSSAINNETNYGAIRQLMLQKRNKVEQFRGRNQLTVVINAGRHSRLQNLVKVLDEVKIVGVKRYFVEQATAQQEDFIAVH